MRIRWTYMYEDNLGLIMIKCLKFNTNDMEKQRKDNSHSVFFQSYKKKKKKDVLNVFFMTKKELNFKTFNNQHYKTNGKYNC